MIFSSLVGRALAVALMVSLFAANAHAAKGIKKNVLAGNNQTITGTILSINNHNGTFVVRSTTPQKRVVQVNGAAIPVVNKRQVKSTFHVSPSTVVVRQDGMGLGLPSIRPGLRARVVANNGQASVVQLYMPQRSSGYVSRYRTHVYRPHYYVYRSHPYHGHHHHRAHR